MLSQLLYISSRADSCSDEDIFRILKSSNSNNLKKDITGVLLYTPKQFLQVLEGEKDNILGLFDHIKTDPRHKNVFLISLKPLNEREFPTWAMGSKGIKSDTYEFISEIDRVSKTEFMNLFTNPSPADSVKVIKRLL